jgi:hypothetical protein
MLSVLAAVTASGCGWLSSVGWNSDALGALFAGGGQRPDTIKQV